MCGKYKKCIFPCKSEDEFLILTEECLTFETVTSCLAQRLRSHVLAGLWAVSPSCTFSPDFKIAGEDVSGGDNYSIPGRFSTEFSSNFRRNSIRFRKSWQILYRVFFEPRVLRGCSNTSRAHSRHSLLSNDFRYINVLILQWRTPDRCLYRVSALLFSALLFFGYVNNFRPS